MIESSRQQLQRHDAVVPASASASVGDVTDTENASAFAVFAFASAVVALSLERGLQLLASLDCGTKDS